MLQSQPITLLEDVISKIECAAQPANDTEYMLVVRDARLLKILWPYETPSQVVSDLDLAISLGANEGVGQAIKEVLARSYVSVTGHRPSTGLFHSHAEQALRYALRTNASQPVVEALSVYSGILEEFQRKVPIIL